MYKQHVANGPKITCAKFGAKLFVRARDMAANVMYYAMGGSYVGSASARPDYLYKAAFDA